MILSLLTGAVLAGIGVFVIKKVVEFIEWCWNKLVGWFQEWLDNHEDVDQDTVGFTVREAMTQGKYNVVQGIFNKRTSKVEDAQRVHAETGDSETMANVLRSEERVTIFE